jgi:FixJ family two-component response regulator
MFTQEDFKAGLTMNPIEANIAKTHGVTNGTPDPQAMTSETPSTRRTGISNATVFVVDDDPGMRRSLCWLFESAALRVETYGSAAEFLAAYDPARPGCLVLDVRMPGMSGPELQDRLNARGACLPIIIVTGQGDVPTCCRAFRAGAVDFLEKPVDRKVLLDRVRQAFRQDARTRRLRADNPEVAARLASLTAREREVLDLLTEGARIKQIAAQLGVSIQTVTKHPSSLLQKLHVQTDVDLVNLLSAFRASSQPK